ncbi:hypothetical protein [Lichenifustis flavocetrariae]|uniref:Autotransporter domain-containing protein n=1 Tax=Lichenifustis flavocetrariae TaxID=2949735 RepID=A0AA42CNI8_9HYPH|nr:hypothetical protein [Lichenifustis flavocetrariae]MCW6509452.1 hypothetical protein [Lichenifustis flavocetrariae]
MLCGASVLALVVAQGGVATADDGSFRIISKGADGTGGGARANDKVPDSTPGADGSAISQTNAKSNVGQPAPSSIVQILSQGGKGALGTYFSVMGGSYYTPGKDGGRGGDVSLTQTGDIVGAANLKVPTSLLTIFSIGGSGSVGATGQCGFCGYIGNGGRGGTVTLGLQSNVNTSGDSFAGVWARSEAGQTGENRTGLPWELGINAADQSKYPGANGGSVSVTLGNTAAVSTNGSSAPGVIAQSIGGAGLDGISYRSLLPGAGLGGAVTFTGQGKITTAGSASAGVVLQSIGGRGGNQLGAARGTDYSGQGGGGAGGKGNDGGLVTAVQTGSIETSGDNSIGLAAMSLGGVGGNGVVGFQGRSGGDGGAAGNGGKVDVIQKGSVVTHGKGSVGVLAQSLGGGEAFDPFQKINIAPGSVRGGGSAGSATSAFFPAGRGGRGGAGGNGGKVAATNEGSIVTEKDAAIGLEAQSVGGGGGAGGASTSVLSFGLGTAAGGNGGGGGNGGDVTIRPAGRAASDTSGPSITTAGNSAGALLAQSVGGGGGVGGSARAGSVGLFVSASYAVGGAGGDGGDGGIVSVDNTSRLKTSGDDSYGIVARSVGGGGGQGGNAAASALAASPPGSPSFSFTFSVGGTGGKGGSGKVVTVDNDAAITTGGQRSYGILATSIGAGGGAGGSAASTSDVTGFYKNFAVAIGIGGEGGGGGSGSTVKVVNNSVVETTGAFSTGIEAASIGGGGGTGGTATAKTKKGVSTPDSLLSDLISDALPVADTWAAKVAVGGTGGDGGKGDAVTVENRSTVVTSNHDSRGILAQSIGGGGGEGGGYSSSGAGEFAGNLSIGGSGGKGGSGGAVKVTNVEGATITTSGAGSTAIFAQSVGGGGGVGGAMTGGKKAVSFPGSAKDATDAVLQVADEIFSINKRLSKQFGNPKLDAAQAGFLDKKSTAQQRLSYAKDALSIIKAGWTSAKNNVAQNEKIRKENIERAKKGEPPLPEIGLPLIVIQSLAESAKTGALNYIQKSFSDAVKDGLKSLIGKTPDTTMRQTSVNVGVGGSGGGGGDGGVVDVMNAGTLQTSGNSAYGILAQSVGGGGGIGGGGTTNGTNWYNINVAIGGSGGNGGNGGAVTVNNKGGITTEGGGAFGTIAQSIGGGGGLGGGAANTDAVASVSAGVNVGGSGGARGDGGAVTMQNSGTITTAGREAHAIVAQSIGGGGGAFFLDQASPVSADLLVTSQAQLDAVNAASDLLKALGLGALGTEGGTNGRTGTSIIPPTNAYVSIGGGTRAGSDGLNTGSGGAVTVVDTNTIETTGLGAMGIFAQSIGGGGGFGAYVSSLSQIRRDTTLGGNGNSRGDGGAVNVTFGDGASVTTSGAGATAVFAQSIGGGGGYAGAGTGAISYTPPTVTQTTSGFWPFITTKTNTSGSTGNGGEIKIGMQDATSSLTIATTGDRAHGIFAQSLGGGGGAWFDTGGGNLTSLDGVQAQQRIGTGSGQAITVNVRGSVTATGKDSYAIFAQSGAQRTDGSLDPTRLGGSIDIDVNGTIKGGSGTGAGIRVDGGGLNNTITIEPGTAVSAVSGQAIIGSGDDRIFNRGTVLGDIVTGAATRQAEFFFNGVDGAGSGASLITQANGKIQLGAGTLYNTATLDIAGVGTLGSTKLNGSFVQNDGRILVDVSADSGAPAADVLNVSGTATVRGGTVQPNVINSLLPGSYTFLTAEGRIFGAATNSIFDRRGADVAATRLSVPAPSLASSEVAPISWSVTNQGANALALQPSANFVHPNGVSLSGNAEHTADVLQKQWNSLAVRTGSNPISQDDLGIARLFADFAKVRSLDDYKADLEQLDPGETLDSVDSALTQAKAALGAVMSCPAFVYGSTLLREGDCVWGRVQGSTAHQSNTADEDGYHISGVDYRVGMQHEFVRDWFFGASLGYVTSDRISADKTGSAAEQGGEIAGALKHQVGAWMFALSGDLNYGAINSRRSIDLDDERLIAQGDISALTAAGRLRTAYQFLFKDWYVKPYLDLDIIHNTILGYSEFGADGFNLDMKRLDKTFLVVSPTMEIGGRIDVQSWTLRPFGTVGITFVPNNTVSSLAKFQDDGSGDYFRTISHVPDKLAEIGLGVQLTTAESFQLTAEYRTQLSRSFISQTGSAKLQYRF